MRTNKAVVKRESNYRNYSHVVIWPGPDGKRLKKYFTHDTEALEWAKEKRAELGDVGKSFGSITEPERAAVMFWREFAKATSPAPPDLLCVLQDFKKSWVASKASVAVSAAVDKFIANQEEEESSKRHVASLKSRLGRFSADNGDKLVSSITTTAFTDWLNGLRATRTDKSGAKLTVVTRINLTRTLRSFFVFCMESGWSLTNPIPAKKRSKSKAVKIATHAAPAIMLPVDVARFMEAVQTIKPSLAPFWSLKFFAGIRDAEAARMDWSMIDLAAGEIHIPAKVSKTGDPRTVKIEPNLDAWLRPYATTGPVVTGDATRKRGFKRIIASLRTPEKEGGKPRVFVFPSNAARHSFGTYHLYHFENSGKTSLQLGHKGNPAMLHEHYKNPTAAKHAAAFWAIRPTTPVNVVSIGKPPEAVPAPVKTTRTRKTAQ